MREIKFRAWGIDRGKMHDVYNIAFHESYGYKAITSVQPLNVNTTFINKEEFILMQFTGLKDKNGVEIYEGDILKVNSPEGIFLGKVVHEIATYGIAAVKGQIIEHFPDNWNDDYLTLLDIYWNNNDDDEMVNSVEVIGNIYENPELLEVEK